MGWKEAKGQGQVHGGGIHTGQRPWEESVQIRRIPQPLTRADAFFLSNLLSRTWEAEPRGDRQGWWQREDQK